MATSEVSATNEVFEVTAFQDSELMSYKATEMQSFS